MTTSSLLISAILKVFQTFAGGPHGVLSGFLPGNIARAHQFDDLVNAVSHKLPPPKRGRDTKSGITIGVEGETLAVDNAASLDHDLDVSRLTDRAIRPPADEDDVGATFRSERSPLASVSHQFYFPVKMFLGSIA